MSPSFVVAGLIDVWTVNPSLEGEGIGGCLVEVWTVNPSFEGEGIGRGSVEGWIVDPSVVAETVSPLLGVWKEFPLGTLTGEAWEASCFG